MSFVIFALILINISLFSMLGIRVILLGKRADSQYLRALAWVVGAACAAFVLGGLQRLAVQAVISGWLPAEGLDQITTTWQLLQSVVALAIALAGFWFLSRAWGPIGLSDHVASTLAGRLPNVDLDRCNLTEREKEVVDVIRQGVISDREIGETMFIASTTAATHVKRILNKTGLHSRRDLLLLSMSQDQ